MGQRGTLAPCEGTSGTPEVPIVDFWMDLGPFQGPLGSHSGVILVTVRHLAANIGSKVFKKGGLGRGLESRSKKGWFLGPLR